MRLQLIILTFLSSFSLNLFSQSAPGYMGKRLNVGYGFNFSPATFGSNGSGSSLFGHTGGHAETGSLAFNSLHEGFIEYAIKTRIMICFSVKYYKSTYDNALNLNVDNVPVKDPASGANIPMSQVDQNPEGYYNITGFNYCLYFKIYHGRFVAPWGGYMLAGITLNTYKCSYDPGLMRIQMQDNSNYPNTTAYLTDFGPQGQFYMRPDVVFGLGKTRVISNRITIDYGFTTQLFALFTTVFDITGGDLSVFTNKPSPTNLNYMEATAPGRIRGANRLNAFIKIGVLF